MTGSNSIANIQDNGNLVIAGSLKISTAVNSASAGQFGILSGETLEVASDQATNSQIDFLGAGQLTIDNAASFGVNVGTNNLFRTADRRVRRRRHNGYPWPFADCRTTALQSHEWNAADYKWFGPSRDHGFSKFNFGDGNVQFRLGRQQRP